MLSQNQEGTEKVIAFANRTLSKSERKYCVTKKELLAVVSFVSILDIICMEEKIMVRLDDY